MERGEGEPGLNFLVGVLRFMSSPSRQSLFSEATRPVEDVERVSGLEYTHPIMLPEDVQAGFEIASPITRAMALLLDLIVLLALMFCFIYRPIDGWPSIVWV